LLLAPRGRSSYGARVHGLLSDIGIATIAATAVGVAAHRLRQPIILAYLAAGALIGPVGLGWIEAGENIEVISEIGLVLLLFIIGLEMDLRQLVAAGRQLLVVGGGGFLLCLALGLGFFPLAGWAAPGPGEGRDVLYLAIACALSSTAIVVKLLYDKFETDTLAGRVTIGVLVIQDLFAILVLAFQPNFDRPALLPVIEALAKSVALTAGGFLVSRFLLRRVFAWIARSPEMVVATSIGWCALVAGVAGRVGLSQEMGALIAGVAISTFPYSIHVTAKTLPLRDFFLTLFFIALGMKISRPTLDLVWQVPLIVAFVWASRFATVYPLLARTGSGRRTAFIATLNLAQISEFSLVIVALGIEHRHVGDRLLETLIYAMAATSVLSSYAIQASHPLSAWWDRLLTACGRRADEVPGESGEGDGHTIVLLGYHRVARAVIERLGEHSPELLPRTLVVDFNPEALAQLRARGVGAVFGDLASLDTLHHARLHHAKVIVSTLPDMLLKGTTNLALVTALRELAPAAAIVAMADLPEQSAALLAAGASQVVLPSTLVGAEVVRLVGAIEV
jgi:Kef-type K+ transport system membrane component KefB